MFLISYSCKALRTLAHLPAGIGPTSESHRSLRRCSTGCWTWPFSPIPCRINHIASLYRTTTTGLLSHPACYTPSKRRQGRQSPLCHPRFPPCRRWRHRHRRPPLRRRRRTRTRRRRRHRHRRRRRPRRHRIPRVHPPMSHRRRLRHPRPPVPRHHHHHLHPRSHHRGRLHRRRCSPGRS